MGDSQTDIHTCLEQKPAHRLAPGSREREPAQDDRDDAVGDHQVEDDGGVGCQAALDLDQPGRPQQVHVGNAGLGHRRLGQVNQPGRDGPVRAGDDERQQPACQQHRERHGCRAHQPRGRPRFVRLIERLLETPCRPCGSLVEGFSRQLVDVWRGQRQHGAPASHDEGGALQHPRFDLMGFSARDEIVHQAARAQRALGGPPPQHARPQDDDGAVEEHDGRRFSRWLGAEADIEQPLQGSGLGRRLGLRGERSPADDQKAERGDSREISRFPARTSVGQSRPRRCRHAFSSGPAA